MKKYQYLTFDTAYDPTEELNRLGKEGWYLLVAPAISSVFFNGTYFVYILKYILAKEY